MKRPNLSFYHESLKRQQELDGFFSKYFYYYRNLPSRQKKLFIKRVLVFIKSAKIIGKQGFQVTYEVKLLIAASAVQLTFGLERFILPKFRTFFIYKDIYYNQLTNQYHKGEVNPKGLTVISWKHFVAGYVNPGDKINVGLHEMAHAFLLNTMYTDLHDPKLDEFLVKVIHLSKAEIEKIKASESHFFRDYAKENIHEFFAVAVEHFFEAPVEFRNELPQLYKYLARLLNQDPANNLYRGINYEEYADPDKENNIRIDSQDYEFVAKPGTSILLALPKLVIVLVIVNMVAYLLLQEVINTGWHLLLQSVVNVITLYMYFFKHYNVMILTKSHLVLKLPLKPIKNYKSIHYDNILFVDFLKFLRVAFMENNKVYYLTSFFYVQPKTYKNLCTKLNEKNVIVKGFSDQNQSVVNSN